LQVQGGAQTEEFQIKADEYEENRHFFLAQYFYDNYNKAMSTLPVLNSNINIIKIEVWRTNVGAAVTENRNLVAITDLGEKNPSMSTLYNPSGRTLPSDNSNNLFSYIDRSAIRSVNQITPYMQSKGFVSGRDYEKIESARKLNPSEYSFNPQLGFISLNQALSADQVLAVAFQYQVIGDTTVYQVGELTTVGIVDPNTLVVKLLKSTTINTKSPLWKLMMKNVYFLKSTQISSDKFRLNVLYEGDDGGVLTGYFADGPKKGIPLIEVFGLDRMDAMQYPYSDGVFDWLDNASTGAGIIQSSTGRIFFPYVEPFGKDLREILGDNAAADKYCFDSLYTLTKTLAQQYPDKDKYYLEGSFSTAMSGEISLGFNIPEGSVRVTAGGIPLVEGVDYTVDYMMGKVRIINESVLSSGTPISISSESNSFSMMTKRMMGMHLNYEFNPKFNLGATILNLHQRPLTQKNNFGDEPLNNTIWGLDLSFEHELPWLTKAIDWLPGISTKDKSTLTLNAEFAHFIPGMSKTNESGTSYIDDFEGAKSGIDLKNVGNWHLASTPQDWQTPNAMFPETRLGSGLEYGSNRARLA
ncbi:MAG: cell surface protein SprA, partial [Bacteroidales bacterium]|nr:cell surface protein SprA [Bacteroidales bacterium]